MGWNPLAWWRRWRRQRQLWKYYTRAFAEWNASPDADPREDHD